MVFLVLTRVGFEQVRNRMDFENDAIWINAGILSETECAELRQQGCDLSRFTNPLKLDDLTPDISTIMEHHPDQVVWVEGLAG